MIYRERSTWLREQTIIEDITEITKEQNWKAGHVGGRADNRRTNSMTDCTSRDNMCRRVRPGRGWRDETAVFRGGT